MSAPRRTPRPEPCESLTATLRLRGQEYLFRLYTRRIRLGDEASIDYYWMDSSQLRDLKSEAAAANFRSVVGYWAAAMREMRLHDDLEQQVHYVLAVCYGLVGRSKAFQHVYRDAYLAPESVRVQSASLPDAERQRVKEVIRSHDRFRVQEELDTTLGRFEPPRRVLPLLQEACRHWVGRGVDLLRREDNVGLEKFLKEVKHWMARCRRKGGHVWARNYLNWFGYECKAAFHTCYANAWVGLIPWLREHRGLDPVSERFLRFWHNQNQPVEVAHGQTPGGILYPTRQEVVVAAADGKGRRSARRLRLRTERIGASHVRDVFSGQVLSLHPLSGFFMKDPALCAIAGRFFATPAHDLALHQGGVELCGSYWDLVGAILTAAKLYRQALDRQAKNRGRYERQPVEEPRDPAAAGTSPETLLEEFAASRRVRCPACGGALRLKSFRSAVADAESFPAEYACRACKRKVPRTISHSDLERWLRRAD
jgi:hypothetical protein